MGVDPTRAQYERASPIALEAANVRGDGPEVVRETADTFTLVFDAPKQLPPYRAGQRLTIDPRQFTKLAAHHAFLDVAEHKDRQKFGPVRNQSPLG